ncbi:phosphoribosyltransferase [Streptomyces aidingensis]|uniref:Predicted phosphoribosyltransferase n=1 Tax=Streptomyces aidingensis TaxID=910347 RepID=A0A1I1HIZ1_9ACTN|nr:phosphoribosyltransferase [Streptomyces aidingensis]SFC23786.1 Predicted phosphoribosyltransferase [Streptomyces aidingensis]
MRFVNREDAGRALAGRLRHLRDGDPVVLGLPRGGVPVAFEVAQGLGAPLDVLVVRKLGVPIHPELGFGAVGEDGAKVINPDVVRMTGLDEAGIAEVERRERDELERRVRRYRGDTPRQELTGRTAVIVDDGIATGSTARAACRIARSQGAARVVLAVPVLPAGTQEQLRQDADEVVFLSAPSGFGSVGQWYEDFAQTEDTEVVDLLNRSAAAAHKTAPRSEGPPHGGGWAEPAERREVEIRLPEPDAVRLPGELVLPRHAPVVVAFAHGSGSGRHSPRNRYVARTLAEAGLGTLLFDLLTPEEELDRDLVFAIPLLARRLAGAARWLREATDGLPVSYFGASTGAAAALRAAVEDHPAAVVSRGGRPDLAGEPALAAVRAPTLLIVGGQDQLVLELNQQAERLLRCEKRLEMVPGATHLFEEPGALEQVAQLARDWFAAHLPQAHTGARAA